MKFLRGLLKFFAVILASILATVLIFTEIALMLLQSASFVVTETDTVIKELFQAIDIGSIFGYSDADGRVIVVPETHRLSDGTTDQEQQPLDANTFEQLINSFTQAFENMPEDKKAQMEAEMENVDINTIVENLVGEPIDDNTSEDEVMGKLYSAVVQLETVQDAIAEMGANFVDKLINDADGDILSDETISNLFKDIATEVKDKTGVELPETLVDFASEALDDSKDVIQDSLNNIVDEDFIGEILGGSSEDGSSSNAATELKNIISTVKTVLSVKTRLIVLAVVLVLGLIIFFLFFKSKAGLIWNAVIAFMSSSVILSIGLVCKNGLTAISSFVPELATEGMESISGLLAILGAQFIKTALIGYAVMAALIVLFVVLKVLKKKKVAKLAAAAETETCTCCEATEEAPAAEAETCTCCEAAEEAPAAEAETCACCEATEEAPAAEPEAEADAEPVATTEG